MTTRTGPSGAMRGRLAPLPPRRKPRAGRPALDHRRFLEAALRLARTGAPWPDLPPGLMNRRAARRRTVAGVWERAVDAPRAVAPDAGREARTLDSAALRPRAPRAGRAGGGRPAARSPPPSRRADAASCRAWARRSI